MTKKILFVLLAIVLIAIPTLAAACSSTTSSAPPTTSTSAPPPTTSTGALPPTTSTAAPPSTTSTAAPPLTTSTSTATTSINIGLQGGITSLDPTLMNGGGGQAGNNVFEYLIGFDPNNKMVPVLADSWSFSPDFLTLTVKLKQGIKFSNGDPLTANDVKFSLEMYAKQPGPTSAQLTQNFSGVTVVDNYTLNFNFPAINVQFLPQTLTNMFIFSQAQYNKVGADAWAADPVGTGPYKFADFKEGQYCDITYNDQYRGPKPAITNARFFYTADPATRISQLQAGETNLIMDVTPSSVAQLTQAGYTKYIVMQPHDICLQFGYLDQSAPWAKVQVRQAIDYAIDKDTLNQKLFGGIFGPGLWQLPWELGYDQANQPNYPYDVSKARQLMSDAGYPHGFDMPLYYPTFVSWSSDMVDYLTSALSVIGITIKPMPASDFGAMAASWQNLHADPTKTGVLLFDVGWPGNPDPTINLTNGFYFTKDNTIFNDPQLNDLITQALQTPDNTARAQIVQQAYKIINDTLPFAPLFQEATAYAYKSNIQYTPSVGGMQANPTNVFDLSYK